MGLALHLRRGTSLEQLIGFWAGFDPILEFVEEPALAKTGLGNDADASEHGARAREPVKLVAQHRELVLPADHPGLETFYAAGGNAERSRLHAAHQIRDHRLLQALDVQRRLHVHVEDAAYVSVCAVADPQSSGGRCLLHPGRDVDSMSADRGLSIDAASKKHGAGVHADSNIEAGQPMPGLNFEFHGVGFGEECQPAPHGALCIVLLHRLRAERGEDTVPGVLKDLSEVRFDDCGEATEGPVDKGAQLFRVQMATQIGGSTRSRKSTLTCLTTCWSALARCGPAWSVSTLSRARIGPTMDSKTDSPRRNRCPSRSSSAACNRCASSEDSVFMRRPTGSPVPRFNAAQDVGGRACGRQAPAARQDGITDACAECDRPGVLCRASSSRCAQDMSEYVNRRRLGTLLPDSLWRL